MRKWHRWLSISLGIIMLFIGVTGVMIQSIAIVGDMNEGDKPKIEARAGEKPRGDGPAKPRSEAKKWEGFIKHLHSGETFGPVGVAISIIAGLALMFFAVSGMWMYWQMWRRRVQAGIRGVFWSR
jgi:uncharacterized iron-regulated membrane protein